MADEEEKDEEGDGLKGAEFAVRVFSEWSHTLRASSSEKILRTTTMTFLVALLK